MLRKNLLEQKDKKKTQKTIELGKFKGKRKSFLQS